MASRTKVNRLQAAGVVFACSLVLTIFFGCNPNEDPLIGTSWRLESYGAISSPTEVIDGSPITLHFESGGMLTGHSGCNAVEGKYETDGDMITITYHTGPGLHCDGSAIVEQERMFLSILANVRSFTIADKTLSLASSDRMLVFTRA